MAVGHKVLFATNRKQLATSGNLPVFSDKPAAQSPEGLICATATVEGTDISKPPSGVITAMSKLYSTAFAVEDLAPILASKNDILVFIHGAANTFEDSIKRAAYNQQWLAAANLSGVNSNFDIITFSWPGTDYDYWNPIGDFFDYRHDQHSAEHSAYHLCLFFHQLFRLRQSIGTRRMCLLCHSMGNYAFAGAVEQWFRDPAVAAQPLFDEVVLAAADETARTFKMPNGGRLSNLRRLAREITVYFNNDDMMMDLSHMVNDGGYRLGYDGPPNTSDLNFFPVKIYEFVDCTGVNDFITDEFDNSHQYYRASPTVRADIAQGLAGLVPKRPKYDAKFNCYLLFPNAPK